MTLRPRAMLVMSVLALLAAHLVVVNGVVVTGQGAGAPFQWPTPSAEDLRLIRGALDTDVHADPDVAGPASGQAPRGYDVLAVARRAKQLGMRGFALKQHYDQSAALAYIANTEVPGIEVYGGVAQNLIVGGLNPASVRHLAEVKGGWGRFVWFPTFDSESSAAQRAGGGPTRPAVKVVANGELVPGAKEVIAAIKDTRTRDANAALILETGYVSPTEALAIAREGQRQGVPHIVISHATVGTSTMSEAQMKEAVALGAWLEFASVSTLGPTPAIPADQLAALMRRVGIEHVIMGSDFGQPGRPMPPDGLALFAGALRRQGLTEGELHQMLAINPAKAMGLAAASSDGAR